MVKTERYRCREHDLMRMLDNERKLKMDAKMSEKKAHQKSDAMAQLLSRQIKLKEMFEDKLRDTLDFGLKKADNDPEAVEIARQRQTKRVLEGFNVELNSLLIQQITKLATKEVLAFDSGFGSFQNEKKCQTEVQCAISRNMDIVILYDKPFKFENTKPPSCDQGSMTGMSQHLIEFIAAGS